MSVSLCVVLFCSFLEGEEENAFGFSFCKVFAKIGDIINSDLCFSTASEIISSWLLS